MIQHENGFFALSEMKDQFDQVTSLSIALLAGEEYGHEYRYLPSVLPDLHVQMSAKDFFAMPPGLPGRAQP